MPDNFRFEPRYENKPKTTLKLKLAARIKLAQLLGQSEREFYLRIKSIEASQLFRKLFRPEDGTERVITFARPYRLNLSERFLEIKDEIAQGGGQLDIQPLLVRRQRAAAAIQAMGEEKFKRYFLMNESGIDTEMIARQCGIKTEEAKEVFELIDEITAHSEFYNNSNIAPEKSIIYSKIAGIEKDGPGKFAVTYYLPHLARGRYSIDHERLNAQKTLGLYTKEEAGQIEALIKQLEAINIRKAVVHRVLEEIIEFQKEYLRTGAPTNLVPFSQAAAAKRLEVSPSIVNRALYSRSVSTPSGKEVPLKDFFPSKKDVVKSIVGKLLSQAKKAQDDKELSRLIMEKYGYRVSRHLVQIYRKELGIAPAGKH